MILEIRVKKRHRKAADKSHKDFEMYNKPCVEAFKVEKAKKTSKHSMANIMKDYKTSEEDSNLNSEERQRLLEKVRKINQKFSKSIKSEEKGHKGDQMEF